MQNKKNKKQTTSNERRATKHGFTLIELVVAIGLLVMVISFSSVIFTASIDGYRTSTANAEIMQKLRAITNQLSSDLEGLVSTPKPPLILVSQDANSEISGESVTVRSDKIAFLATGDFQTTQQYNGNTIYGNTASIFYGLAKTSTIQEPKDKILLRRQMILTSDPNFSSDSYPEAPIEGYNFSLSEWDANTPSTNDWTEKPEMDINDPNNLVMYMAKGVDDFTVQYADWNDTDDKLDWLPKDADDIETDFTTNAFKFMFTLYDSKGIIKNGRRFTHIVHLSKQ